MKEFHLEIVCPSGKAFDGNAQKLVVSTQDGPICIMAGHIDYFSALKNGSVRITTAEHGERSADCTGGIMSVGQNKVRIVTNSFEWN